MLTMLRNLQDIFELTCDRVTSDDIRRYSPDDPGYPEHVKKCEAIRESRELPTKTCVDISDSVAFNGFSRVADMDDPTRFLNYRIWLMTIGIHLCGIKEDSSVIWPSNYIALCLLNDLRDLGDGDMNDLFGDLASDVADSFLRWECVEPESLFWITAEMVWAHRRDDHQRTATTAAKLIEHESQVDLGLSDRAKFLFGSTVYDQFHREWKDTLREITNPAQDEDLHLVLETLDLTNRRKLPYKR